jgi:hypothetical protein
MGVLPLPFTGEQDQYRLAAYAARVVFMMLEPED